MLAILYLLLASFAGYHLFKKLLSKLASLQDTPCFTGQSFPLDNWFVSLPAAFLTGTMLITWCTYMGAYLYAHTGQAMAYGNWIAFVLFGSASVLVLIAKGKRYLTRIRGFRLNKESFLHGGKLLYRNKWEFLLIGLLIPISAFIMYYSFLAKGNEFHVAYSVHSDFGPHLALIRSFSTGYNFPTEYPHFADGSIRYHFLFHFLAGNLEYLGLNIVDAFNVPSVASLVAFLMLLYAFSVMLTGKRWVGIIAILLLLFRSSFAIFTFLPELTSTPVNEVVTKVLAHNTIIGKTYLEVQGIWSMVNIFANQRHLAFGLGFLMLALMYTLPYFALMLQDLRWQNKPWKTTLKIWLKTLFITREGWLPKHLTGAIAMGLLLGLSCFWNGAVVIGTLILLFFLALVSKHRIEFAIIALLTLMLSSAQSGFFMGLHNPAIQPQVVVGFLANQPTAKAIAAYYLELLGILPFMVLIGMFLLPKGGKWLTLVFLAPLIFATLIQITPFVANNHKFVSISVILVNIVAAYMIYRLFTSRQVVGMFVSIVLVVLMTLTGVIDLITFINVNRDRVAYFNHDPLIVWAKESTSPDALFLTDRYVVHPILLAGRKIYIGWHYFPWTAGYNTYLRDEIAKKIYGGQDPQQVQKLVKENRIDYIVVEETLIGNFPLNEPLLQTLYPLVYEDNRYKIRIYRTH